MLRRQRRKEAGVRASDQVKFESMPVEQFVCSICFLEVWGFGNNAEPINNGRCCNTCNDLVITARFHQLRGRA